MGIRFECVHCGHPLHLKEFLAGRRAICPHCQGAIEVPTATAREGNAARPDSASVASGASVAAIALPDPISEAPQAHWYVLPPGSVTKYGPAQGEMMRAWIQQGRVAGDAMVWREGWPDWRMAASVFPLLDTLPQAPAAPVAGAPQSSAVAVAVETAPAGPAVELSIDDAVAPVENARGATRRATGRKARNQQTLIVGLLVVLLVIALPLLVYVLLQ